MDLKFPPLQRPSWLVLVNFILVEILALGGFVVVGPANVWLGVFTSFFNLVAGTVAVLFLTRPFALFPASQCSTVGDLVACIVSLNLNKLTTRHAARSRSDIWVALQTIVAAQLGVDKCIVVPSARFVQDLGAD